MEPDDYGPRTALTWLAWTVFVLLALVLVLWYGLRAYAEEWRFRWEHLSKEDA